MTKLSTVLPVCFAFASCTANDYCFTPARKIATDQEIATLWTNTDGTAHLYAMTSSEKVLGTSAFWHRLEVVCNADTINLDRYGEVSDVEVRGNDYILHSTHNEELYRVDLQVLVGEYLGGCE